MFLHGRAQIARELKLNGRDVAQRVDQHAAAVLHQHVIFVRVAVY